MDWWRLLFTFMFGVPLAALTAIAFAGSVAWARQRRLRPAVAHHRFVPTRTYSENHPSEAFLLRSVSVGETGSARAEIDAFRPPDLP
jgi:hypothetical protein